MSKLFIEESTLSSIGDAIRAKTGKSDLIAPGAMPEEIEAIETTGGGGTEVEPIVLSGDCRYSCGGAIAGKYIELFGDTIITKDITDASYMFYKYTNETIPFDINIQPNTLVDANSMFYQADNLKSIPNIDFKSSTSIQEISKMFADCHSLLQAPKFYNIYPRNISQLFANCYSLRNIPEDFFDAWNVTRLLNYANSSNGTLGMIFSRCFSLRQIPKVLLDTFASKSKFYASGDLLYGLCSYCHALDEIKDIPIDLSTKTSNTLSTTVSGCWRLKNFTFATNEDGSPKVARWKNQTLDLSAVKSVGYSAIADKLIAIQYLTQYNSGITADKEVYDDATYQALKEDPDWFTTNLAYSRYNHDSAVATINSLPDTSAYLATAGGSNTIKLNSASGSATDGGAINTLTEEEIAVATAKGWTVTIV